MKIKNKFIKISLILLILTATACGSKKQEIPTFEFTGSEIVPINAPNGTSDAPVISFNQFIQEDAEEITPQFEEYDIKLLAVGDNLIHMGIVYSGLMDDGTYQYDFLFSGIKDFLDNSDIKIINQETPLAGNNLGFSGYPLFNSPTEVGDAIVNAGFNVVLSATNHSADQGISGIDNIVSYWNQYPQIKMVGLHSPVDDSASASDSRIALLTIKDVTFAILNYTYGPNYGSAPRDLSTRMDILCAKQPGSDVLNFTELNPEVLEDISSAKNIADFVIVCPHWGTEYTVQPSSYQRKFALEMANAGADIIIGTHPHAPQPVEEILSDDGHRCLCYYSLGNYVSTQKMCQSMLEEMAWISFHVSENDVTLDTSKSGVVPLVCHYTANPVRLKKVYLLEDYTDELASSHGVNVNEGQFLRLSDLRKWSQEIMDDWILDKNTVLQ